MRGNLTERRRAGQERASPTLRSAWEENAECGVRNAELQCEVARYETPTLTFRIPNSAFRISFTGSPTRN